MSGGRPTEGRSLQAWVLACVKPDDRPKLLDLLLPSVSFRTELGEIGIFFGDDVTAKIV